MREIVWDESAGKKKVCSVRETFLEHGFCVERVFLFGGKLNDFACDFVVFIGMSGDGFDKDFDGDIGVVFVT